MADVLNGSVRINYELLHPDYHLLGPAHALKHGKNFVEGFLVVWLEF
jgi:hypothetical protein